MLRTFRGGIHPDDGKKLAKDSTFQRVDIKGEFAFPVSMHIGAPAKPVVSPGDHVERGQMIAEAGGFVSAPVYTSASGTVKKIEPRLTATGGMCDCIIIDADEDQGELMRLDIKDDWHEHSRDEIMEIIKTAGIVGMGGAGFPTHVKLSPKEPDKIEYIIANCAECEPYITADYRRMLKNAEELVTGMEIILSLFPGAKGIFAIEDNKPDCIKLLQGACAKKDKIEVAPLKTKYPQGAERQLIYVTTGRAINSDMLPADAGCIVDNAETIYAIWNAVCNGVPLISRSMTVSGDGVDNPGNFLVPIGISHDTVIGLAGRKDNVEKVISGGPMMGFAMIHTDVPVTKTSSAVLLFTEDVVKDSPPGPCINCGRCVEVCPSRIIPSRLAKLSDEGNMEAFEAMNGVECIECGSCSYVCPAKRQLKQSIAAMRKTVLADRRNRKK